jgi:gluconokinase
MIVIVMGVSGAGKSTVGSALSQQLHWRFIDADQFHSAANIAKMRSGVPLTDEDRALWLESLRELIQGCIASKENVVLACSALKGSYRNFLLVGPDVKLVYLRGSFDLIAKRLDLRQGHYMNPHLLRSQFETLEEPVEALTFDASPPVAEIVRQVRAALGI